VQIQTLILGAMLVVLLALFGDDLIRQWNPENKFDAVLMVEIDDEKLSEKDVVVKSLKQGGYVTINVKLAREISPSFDFNFAVLGKDDTFLITPALLNWVAWNGWTFHESSGRTWIFKKSVCYLQSGSLLVYRKCAQ
jgi:hypothetical protein